MARLTFNRDIKLLDVKEDWVHAVVLLDTQCQRGNWISRRLVERLGMSALVSTDFESFDMVQASGMSLRGSGVVNITWRWRTQQATRNYECPFYVFPESDHLDAVFGVEYIVSQNLVAVNELIMLPLIPHTKINVGTSIVRLTFLTSCISSIV